MSRQDSKFHDVEKMVIAVWVATLVATLGFAGVVVWAIIKTVNHFFG